MMSPQVMRSVWGRRKEEKISEPGEKTTLLTSPSTENSIETISLAISDCPGDGGGGGGGEGRGTRGRDCRQVDSEKVERRITNETDKLYVQPVVFTSENQMLFSLFLTEKVETSLLALVPLYHLDLIYNDNGNPIARSKSGCQIT